MSNFNLKSLKKQSMFEGAQGYFIVQRRAWQNCIRCKLNDGKTANTAWEECLKEYQKSGNNAEWANKHLPEGLKKIASSVVDVEKHLVDYFRKLATQKPTNGDVFVQQLNMSRIYADCPDLNPSRVELLAMDAGLNVIQDKKEVRHGKVNVMFKDDGMPKTAACDGGTSSGQAQMGKYWDRINKYKTKGKTTAQAVLATLDDCAKDAAKIPLEVKDGKSIYASAEGDDRMRQMETELNEINALKEQQKQRSMTYQASAKEYAAEFFELPAQMFDVDYNRWSQVSQILTQIANEASEIYNSNPEAFPELKDKTDLVMGDIWGAYKEHLKQNGRFQVFVGKIKDLLAAK
jgi:hypothetical protein